MKIFVYFWLELDEKRRTQLLPAYLKDAVTEYLSSSGNFFIKIITVFIAVSQADSFKDE